jgi:N-acetyltransferase 10
MVKKRVDGRVQGLIEQGVKFGHRSLFVLVGDHGKDQVENLHRILSKSRVKSRPSVLWCYKKELGFSTHKQKRMKEIKRNQSRGLHDPDRDDPFDLFISSTNIRWTYYKESEKILGQTFGMCVLQDFEAITPNLLARTIETVEGGGLVILLFKTVKSLKQLYSMSMDVHSRYRTESHHEVVPRFNERFILTLSDCKGCLVLDDELNILPITSNTLHIPQASDPFTSVSNSNNNDDNNKNSSNSNELVNPELIALQASLEDTPNIGTIVNKAKTLDQANAIIAFLNAISERSTKSTVSLTAARGRGKSAALGLCLAGAIGYGYSNIFITAPSPENLQTTFELLLIGLKSLEYEEHTDYEVIYSQSSNGDYSGKFPIKINVFKDHRQTVEYIKPTDVSALGSCELLAIDEAAAIPLPTVKALLGNYVVFLSSTVHGYEGTGRSLSLKLLSSLRSQHGAANMLNAHNVGNAVKGPSERKGEKRGHENRWKASAEAAAMGSGINKLTEMTLDEPIRYGKNDPVEKWLNNLLCLDVSNSQTRLVSSMPAPRDCELYCVNRDSLFSYHSLSETLLQRIWGLYTSAHYKNSPNDLQMLSDAPAHRLFVLLGPQRNNTGKSIPDVLCVVQIAFEGKISQKSVQSEISKGNKASGDLIPWTISQQFGDMEFPGLSGARIVRVATHPDVQNMGYGSRAIDLLIQYFQGEFSDSTVQEGDIGKDYKGKENFTASKSSSLQEEEIVPSKILPPLLITLKERPAERLHWIGSSFGLTSKLLNFWSRKSFRCCYVRQTANEITGEYSSVCLRELSTLGMENAPLSGWLDAYKSDYRKRLVSLLSCSFSNLDAPLSMSLIDPERIFSTSNDSNNENDNNKKKKKNTNINSNSSSSSVLTGPYGSLPLNASELLQAHFTHHDLKRIELYARNMVDHNMIADTLPTLTRLLFLGRLPDVKLSHLQIAVLISTGLQHRTIDSIANELNLPVNQILAFFNKGIRKIANSLRLLVENETELNEMPSTNTLLKMEKKANNMNSMKQSLKDEHNDDVKKHNAKIRKDKSNNDGDGDDGDEIVITAKDLMKHKNVSDVSVDKLASALNRNKQSTGILSVAVTPGRGKSIDDAASTTTPNTDTSGKSKKEKRKDRHSSGGGDSSSKKRHKKDK